MIEASTHEPKHVHIAIIGSGFAGIGMAVKLLEKGERDFAILERSDEVGGVWRDNTYPGCACDVQSHLYSFSFAPNPTWTRSYSPQREILAYLRATATRFGVLPYVRFGHEVRGARWDAARARWRIETSKGELTADVLVAASGALADPSIPALPGLERFEGKVFHSARWDHDYDLTGKRVAVVGTGASAIQFVPAIQPRVGAMHVYQRTPAWIMPRRDQTISKAARSLYERVPFAQKAVRSGIYAFREAMLMAFREGKLRAVGERVARKHLARQVPDPALRAKLTPDYRLGCKRVLLSDDYLPALTQPNVEVVTDGIREITARGVVATDGTVREVDAIIFGTGFHVTDQPIAKLVFGREGRSLTDVWQGSPQAYLGTTVSGFPNLFFLQGPNTGLGHTSVIVMIEAQIDHTLDALSAMKRRGARAIEPRAEAQAAFVREMDARMEGSVWTTGGCASWYLDETGRNSTLWPGFATSFRLRAKRFVEKDFVFTTPAATQVTGGWVTAPAST